MYLPNLIDLRSTHLSALARRLGAESETSETYDPVQRAAWDLAELLASREDDGYRSREAQEMAFYHEHGQVHPSERRGFPIEPCPSACVHPTADSPCPSFVSQGFGPEGDYEHSLFCSVCGWECAEHIGDDESGYAAVAMLIVLLPFLFIFVEAVALLSAVAPR